MRTIVTEIDKPKFPPTPFLARIKNNTSILYVDKVVKNSAHGMYIYHPPEHILSTSQKGIQVINLSAIELFEGKIILSNNLI